MSPSAEAKKLGMKSLKQAIDASGESRRWFERIHKSKPMIFRAVIIGLLTLEGGGLNE
jgi:hypothetical protein